MPTGTDELTVWSRLRSDVPKMVEQQEKMGWRLSSKPTIGKMKIVEESDLPPSRYTPKGGIWHPFQLFRQFVIPSQHPLVRPGMDLYVIWLPMQKEHTVEKVWVKDEVLQKMIDEDDPLLKRVEIS